jgi:amino acid adenylation domain-containing protein
LSDVASRLEGLSPARRQLLLQKLRHAAAAEKPLAPPLVARPRGEAAPLSFAQQRLWFLARLEPESTVYNVPGVARLRGDLDTGCLQASLDAVARRQEALRTTFALAGGQPVQRIAPEGSLPLVQIDLSGLDEEDEERGAELRRTIESLLRRPFDLERGPLAQAVLVRLAEREHALVLVMHHIISDGWSARVLLQELGTLYLGFRQGRPAPLPELPVQYADFAIWQREWLCGEELERLLSWWRERLAGTPRALELTTDRPRLPQASSRGGVRPVDFGPLTATIHAFSRSRGVTPFMTLLAAFAAVLGRHAGQDDVVVGIPVANRTRKEIEGLIGFFVNSLPLRIGLAGDPDFAGLVERARDAALGGYAHQDLPFEKLVDDLRPGRESAAVSPLFQVVLQVHNELGRPISLPGLEIEIVDFDPGTAKFDMVLNLDERDGELGGVWRYRRDLFDATTVERMLEHLRALLAVGLDRPERKLSELALLTPGERHALLYEWAGGEPASGAASLVDLFHEQVARTPEAVAVEHETERLTYGDLADRAVRLAGHLRANGVRPGDLVALYLDRSLDLVVAILAVLEAGAAYAPLDPAYPAERVRLVLEDTAAPVLVTAGEPAAGLPETAARAARVIRLDLEAAAIAARPAVRPGPSPTADDLAYVLYTSGSTGRPKGVLVQHRHVARLFAATRPWFEFGERDVWTLFHSYAFDFSVWEIWGALLHGGRLVVVPYWVSRSPESFLGLLLERGVTVLNQTPSAFRQLLAVEAARRSGLPELRAVVFGGEALDPASLRAWWEMERPAALVNMYGITETTVHVTFRRIGPEDAARGERGSVIGVPIPDLRVFVTVPDGAPAPIGVPGEILVGGAGVAAGYLARPELTAERFVPDPWSGEPGARLYRSGDLGRWLATGELEYLGRIDHQVKVRGFRIELGEIESALAEHPAVRDAAVLALDEGDGQRRLVAYVVAERAALSELRDALQEKLPAYMVPASFVFLDALPLTPTGKLDRRALSRIPLERPERSEEDETPLRTPMEQTLAGLWREVLGVERIGANDDFFALGGDSIKAAVLANRLQEKLGEIVHVVATFDAPRLADLASYLESHYPEAVARIEGAARGAAPASRASVDENALALAQSLVRPLSPPLAGEEGEPRNPPAVFLLSAPRSGSTLLRVLLGGHPRLFSPPELELLSFRTLAERAGAFAGRDAFWLEGLIRAVMEIEGCDAAEARERVARCEREGWSTRRFYRWLQERLGDRRLVDKTPSYALAPDVLDRAEREFADARYVHLVRHPCGMIRSFEEARLDQIFFRYPHPFSTRELAEAVWCSSQRNILDFLSRVPAERRHRVRFEDLVRDPRSVLQGICGFLGLELDPAMLNPYLEGERRMTDGLHAESRMLGDVKFHRYTAIEAGVADSWRGEVEEGSLGEPAQRLARDLGYGPAAPQAPIPASDGSEEDTAPLSFAQERLWLVDQIEPGLPAYNLPLAVRLSGPLQVPALRAALSEVVRRHAALRTTFAAEEGGAVQRIHPAAPVPLPEIDLSGLAGDEEARRLARAEAWAPFDLAAGPLLRCALLRLARDERWLLLTMHHIVSDGWSLGILLRELSALYEAFRAGQASPLSELPIRYVDFARWQRGWLRGETLERQIAWWRAQLADDTPLALPLDRPRPALPSFRGASRAAALPPALYAALAALGREQGATPFMVLLAAFQALLHRWTGQTSIAVGTPVANRNRREIEGLIGFFVNMLVVRTDASGEPGFLELLGRVRRAALGAYAHQDVPFEKLVEELRPRRDGSRNPLFQVVFHLGRSEDEIPPGIELEPLDLESRLAKFDLKLGMDESRAVLEYGTDLFDATTMERLLRQLRRLLEAIAAAPERRLGDLALLGEAEQFQLLAEWNDTASDYPREACVQDLFERQAAIRPDAVAVVFGDERLTYGELNRRANRLAWRLRELGVGPEARVGVCLERSPELIVALLGALKAGGAYVPFDLSLPAERLALLMADAAPAVVLVSPGQEEQLPDGPWRPVWLSPGDPRHGWEEDPPVSTTAESLVYILYTSGSTGLPKGVAAVHRAVARLAMSADYVDLGPEEVFLQASPIGFDASTLELWGSLLHGGRLVLAPPDRPSLAELGAIVAGEGVSTLWLTAALFEQMVAEHLDDLRGVRQLLAGGDVLPPAQVRAALAAFAERPDGVVVNGYGPTENTTFTCCHRMTSPDPVGATVSIGRPIANGQVYLLDAGLLPVPLGSAGELCCAGDGLARGYWARPDLTAERFVPDPIGPPGSRMYRTGDRARWRTDGRLEFLGRLDEQVKLRGFRVEPGEVEAALSSHPGVRQAIVLALGDGPADRRLAAFVAGQADAGELRSFLKGKLPPYMVPARIVVLESLPRTPNGKVDRRALATFERLERATVAGSGRVPPRTETEIRLAAIWSELLGIESGESVSADDDFFELGGHSLLATQLVTRVRKDFGVDLPLRDVFEAPVLSAMAEEISHRGLAAAPERIERVEREEAPDLDQLLADLDRLTDEEAARLLAEEAE